MYAYMYMCTSVCLWRSEGQAWVLSSGIPANPLIQVSHLVWNSAVYLTCLARELQESSCVPSTGIACTQHGAWHFYVVGGVFVVSVCLMECFSSSALAVMSNTVNFNILLFVFCLLQFFFTPFPLSAQFCLNKTLYCIYWFASYIF